MNADWIAAIAALGPLRWGHWALLAIGFFLLEIVSPIAFFHINLIRVRAFPPRLQEAMCDGAVSRA